MRKKAKSRRTEKGLHAATRIDKISTWENGKRQPFPLYKNIRSQTSRRGTAGRYPGLSLEAFDPIRFQDRYHIVCDNQRSACWIFTDKEESVKKTMDRMKSRR